MLNSRVPIQVLVTQPDLKTSTLGMELAQVPKSKSKPWKKILEQVFFREQLWCNCVNFCCVLFFMFHDSDLISWYSLFIFRFKSFLVRKYRSWNGLFPGQCWWVQVLTNLMSPSPTHPHFHPHFVVEQIFRRILIDHKLLPCAEFSDVLPLEALLRTYNKLLRIGQILYIIRYTWVKLNRYLIVHCGLFWEYQQ